MLTQAGYGAGAADAEAGSRHLAWTGTGAGGGPAAMTGELHFGWVLGGRAGQDAGIAEGCG